MPPALQEVPRVHQRTGPDIVGIGTAVIDLEVNLPGGPSEEKLPQDARAYPIDKKITAPREIFWRIHNDLVDRGATFRRSVGGNISSVGEGVTRLTDLSFAMHTWAGTASDEATVPPGEISNLDLIKQSLQGRPNLHTHVVPFDGEPALGLVVPRVRPDGTIDKTTIGLRSYDFPSDYDVEGDPQLIIVNSLTGGKWPENLRSGTDRFKRDGRRVSVIPGSSQFKSVDERSPDAAAVYDSIENSYLLPVNGSEMAALLEGKGEKPSENPFDLARQGRDVLGAEITVVTFGKLGAIAVDSGGPIAGTAATPVRAVRGTNRAGDFFLAGFVASLVESEGDIEHALRLGSAHSSFPVESPGHLPTREEVDHRLRTRPPGPLALAS